MVDISCYLTNRTQMFLSGIFIFTHLDAVPHFLLYFFHSLLFLTAIPESPRTTLSFKYVK